MKQSTKRLYRLSDMLRSLGRLDVPVYAGNAAYFIILSAFPMVMLLLNLLSYTTLSNGAFLDILEGVLPETFIPAVQRLLNGMVSSSSTTLASVSALATLWAASRGVYGILVGLNRIYGVHEDRGYIFTRTLSLIYTFLFLLVLILTLALHVFGQTILARIPQVDHPAFHVLWDILSSRYPFLFLLQTALFEAIFMFLPNRRNGFFPSLPGAVLASLGWLLFSNFFSIYVEYFSNYTTVYGSLSVVALAMLWLYICVAIVFYGGALNKYLSDIGYEIRRRKKQRLEDEGP